MAIELHGGKPQSPLVNAGAMSCGQLNLAEMTMEGLYDSSGDWAYSVGLPAKSGVGGGIMAVAPGKLGIAAFSPPT
jgi:glutaminase